jgi:hypothetical protein
MPWLVSIPEPPNLNSWPLEVIETRPISVNSNFVVPPVEYTTGE